VGFLVGAALLPPASACLNGGMRGRDGYAIHNYSAGIPQGTARI
jgi:hypothetical protein